MNISSVIDLHYEILLGTGWTSGDYGNTSVTTATSIVSQGSYEIPVASNFGLNAGILASYKAANGEWYAFRIRESSSNLIKSDRPLEAISIGGTISNSYINDAHPNGNGGAMIVDSLIRKLNDPIFGKPRELEKVLRDTSAWSSFNSSLDFTPVTDYTYVGSSVSGFRACKCSGTGTGGVISPEVSLLGGDYILSVPINTGTGLNTVTISVEEISNGSVINTTTKSYTGYTANYLAEVPFYTDGGKTIRVRISSTGTSWNFIVGKIQFARVTTDTINLNSGKLVLFGDSWTTPGSPIANALTSRLTNMTVVAKGVGGNRCDQMIARFSADVSPENPTLIINIVGTNDYYQSVSASTFESNISILKSLCKSIGAQTVLLTPSVGSIIYSPSQMFPSRYYLDYVRYLDLVRTPPSVVEPYNRFTYSITDSIGGLSTNIHRVTAGDTKSEVWLTYLSTDNPNIIVEFGSYNGTTFTPKFKIMYPINRTILVKEQDTKLSGLFIRLSNTSTSNENINILSSFIWKGDLN